MHAVRSTPRRAVWRDGRIVEPARTGPQRRDGVDLGGYRVSGLLVGNPPADEVGPGLGGGALDREIHRAQPLDRGQEFLVAQADPGAGSGSSGISKPSARATWRKQTKQRGPGMLPAVKAWVGAEGRGTR